jgi:hypothetical protein
MNTKSTIPVSTVPATVLVLHAAADRHHLLALQREFEAQPEAAWCRLVPFAIPRTMCRSAITRFVLSRADVVVHLLSPRYLEVNPDWAEQHRSARLARSGPRHTYTVLAEPVDVPPLRSVVKEILCLFANAIPEQRLALDREWRDIDEANRRAGSPLSLTPCWAARIRDLQDAMLDRTIDILHFSGHGERGGLCFETEAGRPQLVEVDRLVRVLATCRPRCLVFNACHSADALESIRSRVPYVIAMRGPTPDQGSIEFSRAFYAALARGRTIPQAFQHARDGVSLHDDGCVPQLFT